MDTKPNSCQISPYRVRIASGGRIVIPAEVRQELGVKDGEELLLSRDDAGFRLTTHQDAISRIQALFASLNSDDGSIVDELLRERREEAIKEEREFNDRYGTK